MDSLIFIGTFSFLVFVFISAVVIQERIAAVKRCRREMEDFDQHTGSKEEEQKQRDLIAKLERGALELRQQAVYESRVQNPAV